MTTKEKIEKALFILKYHDWMWPMADYNAAQYEAQGSMRAFVSMVASIEDKAIIKALRSLWIAKYEYVHATYFAPNEAATAKFKQKEAELMAIIMPTNKIAA